MILEGNPEFGVELEPIDFAMVATACGAKGYTIERPEDAEHILREALAHRGPTVVQAVVDPNEPPMPGKITTEQALHFAKALARGQKDALKSSRPSASIKCGRSSSRWPTTPHCRRATPVLDLEIVANHIREGRFQRSLALLTAATSVVSGLEVAYEHYRGSYSRRVMYTPVILSVLLAIAGVAGFFSRRAARSVLRLVSFVTLIDALVGFYFHVRGIKRKPGGWRLPMTNMIMGPPIFAPFSSARALIWD